jgi:hypothetical protein
MESYDGYVGRKNNGDVVIGPSGYRGFEMQAMLGASREAAARNQGKVASSEVPKEQMTSRTSTPKHGVRGILGSLAVIGILKIVDSIIKNQQSSAGTGPQSTPASSTPVAAVPTCSVCGQTGKPSAKFCWSCGSPM